MASTILVGDLLARVSEQLQDDSPQFERWSQVSMVRVLNDAQRVLAKYLPHSCSRVDAIKLVPGTRQTIDFIEAARIKPGDGSVAVDMRGNRLIAMPTRNMGANGLTPGRAIRGVERVVLDQSDPSWHAKTAKVVTMAVYDPQTPKVFYVSPGVPATGGDVWVELPWLPDPIAHDEDADYSSDGSTVISVPDVFGDDVLHYMLARLYMKDAEVEATMALANSFAQMFVSSVNTQAVAAGLPDPKLRVLPTPYRSPNAAS